ncbi:50S ribosomal protein L7/L12 [Buchnera aphidicola (Ceratoglyphina bambusae)]|uniref:50S ribosomal protein L7/L12 n=1 Tax=Buchnera aphidicola TaxID=9 RepID=UPI0031B85334
MSISKNEIVKEIEKMSVKDVLKLISIMEKKFNISSKDLSNNTKTNDKLEEKEKTEFSIFLQSVGPNKISVIKSIRSITGLGLKESKDLVESAPVIIKEKIDKKESEILKETLEKSGAIVEIK